MGWATWLDQTDEVYARGLEDIENKLWLFYEQSKATLKDLK